uniref:Uncharacterized protein n=1 Tax=Globisporangium ultimum (strain ATCC 200006 / CBS 805.95 / DAOM BR144) TaxID=431595 RepID=K3WKB9_GLOUD
MGIVFAGSVLAEITQREPEVVRGSSQTMSYAAQQLFSCLSTAMYGGDFSSSMRFNAVMGVRAFFSLAIFPVSWYCISEDKVVRQSGRQYIAATYELIQQRAMYQIIAFRFFHNMFAWVMSTAPYLAQSLWVKVTPVNSSLTSTLGYFVATVALYGAKNFFTIWDVYRSQWFWLGVPIVEYLPYFAEYTISTLAVVETIEVGNEGGVYGLLMTVENVAYPFTTVVSKDLCANFDIGYEFFQVDDHYARASVKAKTQELKSTGGKSKWLGNGTIAYITFAFLWSLMTNRMTFSNSTSCLKIAGGDGC